jgi:DNA-cytosine methyltransferase
MKKWVRGGLILMVTLGLLSTGHDKLFPQPIGRIPDGVIENRKATADEKSRNRKLAKEYAAAGWDWRGKEWVCLKSLWTRESRFDNYAKNQQGSSAYGIAQLLRETDHRSEYQILRGLKYIKVRHQSPCRAWIFLSQTQLLLMSKLTGVSLFAGVGGFDLAMERNGVDVVANVEIDKQCQKVLAKHFPNAKQFSDITDVKGSDLIGAGFKPERGIITGGFPCQDLSVAGKRRGLAGERSGLFWEIARLIEETKTEWFILENVPGLLTSNKGADFGVVVGTMADIGYSLAWRVLDAQHFGVPQRRRRVFILGRRTGDGLSPAEVLFKSEGLRRNTTQSKPKRQDTATSSTRSVNLASGKPIANTIPAELYHHGSVVNQDANNGHVVIEGFTSSSFAQYTQGVGTLRANGGDLGGGSETFVVEQK